MSIRTFLADLQSSIFGEDPLKLIRRKQGEIVAVQAKAQDVVSHARLDIEDAVDFELDNIRQTVASATARIRSIVGTGAVNSGVAVVLNKAEADIEAILITVDAAI